MPSDPVPLAFQQHFAEMDELQLQVRTLGADWDALIQTASRFPEPMAEIWRVVYDYLVTTDRPREGSIENAICAEYILRVKARPFPRPPPLSDPAGRHAFKSSSIADICEICRNGPNSAIHRPGAPR